MYNGSVNEYTRNVSPGGPLKITSIDSVCFVIGTCGIHDTIAEYIIRYKQPIVYRFELEEEIIKKIDSTQSDVDLRLNMICILTNPANLDSVVRRLLADLWVADPDITYNKYRLGVCSWDEPIARKLINNLINFNSTNKEKIDSRTRVLKTILGYLYHNDWKECSGYYGVTKHDINQFNGSQ